MKAAMIKLKAPAYKHHDLKTIEPYFEAVQMGWKNFEVRLNDRDFQVNDYVRLHSCDEQGNLTYPPRHVDRRITYILHGPAFGVSENHCVLALQEVEDGR
jgi:hypothetical protein